MDLWTQKFSLLDDCLRSCVFTSYIWEKKPQEGSAWVNIADLCYSDAILSWNKLFGQKNQETHWSKLSPQVKIPEVDALRPFDRDLIIEFLKISEEEWNNYHKSMVDFRNTRLAHLNMKQRVEMLPNLTLAMHCCYLYRDWLSEALRMANRSGQSGHKIKVADQKASDSVKFFKEQIKLACNGL